jgi:Tfp pilus assembly protein PilN
VNLLTPALHRRASVEIALAALRSIGAILLCYGIVAAIVLLAGRAIVEWNFARVVERSTLVLRTAGAASREAQTTNEMLLALESLQHSFTPWASVMAMVAERAPSGITLTAANITADGALHLEGRAATRDDLLAFQERLRTVPYLTEVTVPFSNLLLREQIVFSIDATVERGAVPIGRATGL